MRARPALSGCAAIVLLALLSAGCGGSGHDTAADTTHSVRWDGLTRTYTVQAKRHPARNAPIFMILHLRQRQVAELPGFADLPKAAARRGFVVVTPMGVGYSWNAGACCDPAVKRDIDDVGFLRRVIADVRHQYGNAHRPVVVAGFSNGGFMAYRLACEGIRLAGIALVEAAAGVDRCHLAGPTNYLQIHQTGDTVVPFAGAIHPVVPGAKRFPSVAETSARWRTAAACKPDGTASGTADLHTATYACAGGSTARVTVMDGGSHDWPVAPPDPIDATKTILDFFTSHR